MPTTEVEPATAIDQKCLCANCESREIHCRGLCRPDYVVLHGAVSRGEITWKTAERRGLCLPPAKPGRKSKFEERFGTT